MTTSTRLRLLHIEDCSYDSLLVQSHLSAHGFDLDFHRVESVQELEKALTENEFDLIICDHNLPSFDSIEAIAIIKRHCCLDKVPVIVVSGTVGEDATIDAMRAGAHDLVAKNDLNRFVPAVERSLRFVQDLKKQQETEQRLLESNQKLREAVATVTETQDRLMEMNRLNSMGQMSSGIAHDFNNVLTKMLGHVELMLVSSESIELTQSLNQLKTLAKDGAAVVRRLRQFYKTPTAQENFEAVDLKKVIDEVVELSKPKWKSISEAKGRSISVRKKVENTPAVAGESSEIREILTNLLFNACDAMPNGGEIVVKTEVATEHVVIRVTDTGCGMSQEVIDRCLEPFFTTKGEQGTGLGLAMVRNIVQRFNGKLEIESKEGRGTTVSVILPIHHAVQHGPSGNEPEKVLPEGVCFDILLVDDDPHITTILTQYLKLDGHRVTSVADGRSALQAIEDRNFDVVISDRSMPGMSGDELAQVVKALAPTVPFIMSSGFGDQMLSEGEIPQGIDYILPKPLTRRDLRKALASVAYMSSDVPELPDKAAA